jgi:two-component system, NarL family, nitrate/nitrite response regulator NarL
MLGRMTLRVLIVDDSAHFLRAARSLLERQGLTVVGVALDGAAALRQAQALRPDVTLVDLGLGGESGIELARRLARVPGLETGLVLISTHDPDDFAELIAASPAVGFLAKSDLSARAILDLVGGQDPQPTGPGGG